MPATVSANSEETKHEGEVTASCFHNDLIYTSGADGKIKVWDQDLNLQQEFKAHDAYIYAIAIDVNGKLYTATNESVIKCFPDPLNSEESTEIVKCDDEIQSLTTDGEILYSGDDKGVVTVWKDGEISIKYFMIEEVRSLAAHDTTLYTVRDRDVIVSTLRGTSNNGSGMYVNRATIEGASPICLIGAEKEFLVFSRRGGKGLMMIKNKPDENFKIVWKVDVAHDMIINAVCGTSDHIYTGAWDGVVKKWINLETQAKCNGTIDLGDCVNTMTCTPDGKTVFAGCTDGMVRKVVF